MAAPDPFHGFASDCEMPIRSARAIVIAIRHMTDSDNPDEVVVEAIGHLANDAWTYLNRVLETLEEALAEARRQTVVRDVCPQKRSTSSRSA